MCISIDVPSTPGLPNLAGVGLGGRRILKVIAATRQAKVVQRDIRCARRQWCTGRAQGQGAAADALCHGQIAIMAKPGQQFIIAGTIGAIVEIPASQHVANQQAIFKAFKLAVGCSPMG